MPRPEVPVLRPGDPEAVLKLADLRRGRPHEVHHKHAGLAADRPGAAVHPGARGELPAVEAGPAGYY